MISQSRGKNKSWNHHLDIVHIAYTSSFKYKGFMYIPLIQDQYSPTWYLVSVSGNWMIPRLFSPWLWPTGYLKWIFKTTSLRRSWNWFIKSIQIQIAQHSQCAYMCILCCLFMLCLPWIFVLVLSYCDMTQQSMLLWHDWSESKVISGMSTAVGIGTRTEIEALHIDILCIPRTQLTSIFEGQPSKTRPNWIKTRVIWVLGIHIYIYYIRTHTMFLPTMEQLQLAQCFLRPRNGGICPAPPVVSKRDIERQ